MSPSEFLKPNNVCQIKQVALPALTPFCSRCSRCDNADRMDANGRDGGDDAAGCSIAVLHELQVRVLDALSRSHDHARVLLERFYFDMYIRNRGARSDEATVFDRECFQNCFPPKYDCELVCVNRKMYKMSYKLGFDTWFLRGAVGGANIAGCKHPYYCILSFK